MTHYQLIVIILYIEIHTKGGIKIKINKIISEKKDIIKFLNNIKTIINNDSFDINKNFFFNSKDKPDNKKFSTPYTVNDLEYDTNDVIKCISELTINEYSETVYDKDDSNPPLLFVFGKIIQNKLVYIKLKIREQNTKKIICISFHYAKHDMNFPYKK